MLPLLVRILEILAIAWLMRFLWKALFGGVSRMQASRKRPFHPGGQASSQEPRVIAGEMKKDPQCGTYVSTELSLKSRYHNEVLHFCSPQCQEQFLKAQASKSA